MSKFRHVVELEFPDDESPRVILDKFMEALELAAKEMTTKDLAKFKVEEAEDTGVTLTVEAEDKGDLPMILEMVSNKISEGYTSGYEPTWSIEGGE